ncbi:hypothetical protein C8R45DRAFT_929802 [Mycena sanguinolenta]|nr:hypothetical protein C8R45DRAFT_929802 [Mycena sanguinolenta]
MVSKAKQRRQENSGREQGKKQYAEEMMMTQARIERAPAESAVFANMERWCGPPLGLYRTRIEAKDVPASSSLTTGKPLNPGITSTPNSNSNNLWDLNTVLSREKGQINWSLDRVKAAILTFCVAECTATQANSFSSVQPEFNGYLTFVGTEEYPFWISRLRPSQTQMAIDKAKLVGTKLTVGQAVQTDLHGS